ncbi:MAG: histidine kinase [Desulfuromonas sp.]|nr:histidine kinase [Desulfuromonas sp.]
MSALWRINVYVTLFFAAVVSVCLAVLLRQAEADVQRELDAAQVLVDYLAEAAPHDPERFVRLEGYLRHVRLELVAAGESSSLSAAQTHDRLTQLLYPQPAPLHRIELADGRTLLLAIDPQDEVEEAQDSIVQLLGVFALALLLTLLTIRWAVRRGLLVLDDVLLALQSIGEGQLAVRLQTYPVLEAERLAEQFNKMATALESTQAENIQLTRALLNLQDTERSRLGQTLHDDLGQYVAGMRAQIKLLQVMREQPNTVLTVAQVLEEHGRQLQTGFRCLVRDLYPAMLDHLGVVEMLGTLQEHWQKSHGSRCRLHILSVAPDLTVAQKNQLYRFLQEALTNVSRHAQATQVHIWLQYKEGALRLLLTDNGIGSVVQNQGLGLRSMAERARTLSAQLHIQARLRRGWSIYLYLPLAGESNENIIG